MKVIKKDGTFEDYSFKKIINAIEKSAEMSENLDIKSM